MGYDHQTTVQISDAQREQWEQFIQTSDLRGKGELVREAVTTYIQRGGAGEDSDLAQEEAINSL